jgi:ribose transport system permease protein
MSKKTKDEGGTFLTSIKRVMSEYVIIYAVVILVVVLSVSTPAFLSMNNLMNVLRQTSMIAIIAVGMFFIMVGGGIDISMGAIVGLTGIVFSAGIVKLGWNPLLAGIIALAAGAAAGSVTGVTVSYLGIPPFIATLGMMSVARGFTYVLTNAYPISGLPNSIAFIGRGYLGYWESIQAGIPWPVVLMILVFIIAHFISQKTKFGRFVYAAGGNPEAAYLSGIKVKRVLTITYIVGGFLSALSGIILVSRLASGQPNAGIGWEFEAVISAVIGGVSITGGKGKVVGVFFGAILIGLLTNGMTLLNVSSYYQQIIKGLVLVFAIGLDVYKTKKQNRV